MRILSQLLFATFLVLACPSGQAEGSPAAQDIFIQILTESGYTDERGRQFIDLLEDEYAYITIKVETIDGKPMEGVTPKLNVNGSSRIQSITESGAGERTDADGYFEFAVVGGKMGLDTLSVGVNTARAELKINVISLKSAGFADPASVEGTVPWSELLQARVEYQADGSFQAQIPQTVEARSGKKVKLAGFMLPLEPERLQKHFLLTSSPPSCFFHVPGGPAGAIEVFAPKGVETRWDLVVMEGTFQTVQSKEGGAIYRLLDAREAP